MPGYDQHILDPWLNPKIVQNFDEVDKYRGVADEMFINKDLEKFGQDEQKKIFGGQIGSTLLAGAARTQGARDIAGLKASQRLGSAAMSRAGGNASSAGVNLLYDRMLKNEIGRVNDRTADQVVGGLPGYLNSAAGWAEAGNRGRMQKLSAAGAYQQMFSNAVKLRQSNQTFEKKKSFWDKLKEGIGIGTALLGIGGSIGSFFQGGQGGGGGGPSPLLQGDTGAGNQFGAFL